MVVKDGRFGPYVTDGEYNASLRAGDTVEELTPERAAELLADRRAPAGPAKKKKAKKKKAAAKKKKAPKPRRRPGAKKAAGPKKKRPGNRRPSTTRRWPSRTTACYGDEDDGIPSDQMADVRTRRTRRTRRPPDAAPTRVFGTAQFQRLWIAQVVSALGDWLGLPRHRGAGVAGRFGLAGCGHRPGDVGPHHPRLPLLGRRRRAGRPLGPQEGDGHLQRHPGRGGLPAPVRGHGRPARGGLAGARAVHAPVVAGQGGVGPAPGAGQPPHHRQLVVARRRLRHLPVGGGAVLGAHRGGRRPGRLRPRRHPQPRRGGPGPLRRRRHLRRLRPAGLHARPPEARPHRRS